jgi:hypothetical protein
MQFSSKIVIAAVTAVVIYTTVMVWLVLVNISSKSNVWPPAELTALWFAFWTVELVMLASIKKDKIKNKYERGDEDER